MERKTDITNVVGMIQKNHPVDASKMSQFFLRGVTAGTRESPRLRIANLAAGFMNQGHRGTIRDLLLCNRDCCQVVSEADGSRKTNRYIIRECLSSDDISSRRNSVKLICHMLNDENQDIKNMAKDILREVFRMENINYMIGTRGHIATYSWLFSTLVLYKEALFGEGDALDSMIRNIGEFLFSDESISVVLKNVEFACELPMILDKMLHNGNLKDGAIHIVRKLFSDKNIGVVLKDKGFMHNLPWLLDRMFDDANLKNEAIGIIGKLFSDRNINVVLSNKDLVHGLLQCLRVIVENKEIDDMHIIEILSKLFSKQNISIMSKDKDFILDLSSVLEQLLFDKKHSKIVVIIIKKLFSVNENIDIVFKNENFVRELLSALASELDCETVIDIIEKLSSDKRISVLLKNKNLASMFLQTLAGMFFKGNEMLENEAINIIQKLFSGENIGAVLENEDFIGEFPSILTSMYGRLLYVNDENLRKKLEDITEKLFSDGDIDVLSKNEKFISYFSLHMMNDMFYDNPEFREKIVDFIERLLSGENSNVVLKNWYFLPRFRRLFEEMFKFHHLRVKSGDFIEKIFSEKNICATLNNSEFMCELPLVLEKMSELKFGTSEENRTREINHMKKIKGVIDKLLENDSVDDKVKLKLLKTNEKLNATKNTSKNS